jgi:hypothetical protein
MYLIIPELHRLRCPPLLLLLCRKHFVRHHEVRPASCQLSAAAAAAAAAAFCSALHTRAQTHSMLLFV